MVQVAPPDWLPAGREPAGDVARGDLLPQPGRRPVTRAGLGMRTTAVRGGIGRRTLSRSDRYLGRGIHCTGKNRCRRIGGVQPAWYLTGSGGQTAWYLTGSGGQTARYLTGSGGQTV